MVASSEPLVSQLWLGEDSRPGTGAMGSSTWGVGRPRGLWCLSPGAHVLRQGGPASLVPLQIDLELSRQSYLAVEKEGRKVILNSRKRSS